MARLDRRIAAFDNEFAARARNDADARRLATIPGIGMLNATALVAAVGNGQTFARGRVSRLGSGWYRDRLPPAERRVWSASPSEATNICAS